MNIIDMDNTYVAHSYGRYPICITKGSGSRLYDENGKEYIDFGTGIAVNTLGISDDIWKQAVIEQINKVQHTSNLYYTEPCAKLAEMLCKKTGLSRVFFPILELKPMNVQLKPQEDMLFLSMETGIQQ